MKTVEAFAPAKINLTLHVTGQRKDGLHLLDSLVVFADIGDHITVTPASRSRLTVSGPMAEGVPVDGRNLVLRAAELVGVTADIHLEKHLPASAGLGGGSSDAAATLRALSEMSGKPVPDIDALLTLGADVPLCLHPTPIRMRGIGDSLQAQTVPQDLHLILINPRVPVPTGVVFQGLTQKEGTPMDAAPDPHGPDWLDWLRAQRNDLERPAIDLQPIIAQVLTALRGLPGCQLARMSGSGATCFAILKDAETKRHSVAILNQTFPDWWVQPCRLNPGPVRNL